jgi:hypothetical protein
MNKNINLTGKTLLSQLVGADRPALTAKQFLGKEPGTAYYQSDEFLTFVKSLRKREVTGLKTVLVGMGEGLRVGGSLEILEDKGGRDYVYVTMLRANSHTGGKYIYEGGMIQFLNDYTNAKFVAGFTLDELYEEAMKN